MKPTTNTDWCAEKSADLYGVHEWGGGYFAISEGGDAIVKVGIGEHTASVALTDIVKGMKERGLEMPAILRIENVLDHRIKT